MATPIRILIADDHKLFRQSLRSILLRQSDFAVVGEAENGLAAIQQAEALKPDIVLMDVRMPVMGGLDATRRIADTFPEMKIIALSSHSEDLYIQEMLKAGASSYFDKQCRGRDLVNAIYSAYFEGSERSAGLYA